MPSETLSHISAADVEQRSLAVPVQMLHQMLMYACHHIALAERKPLMAQKHIDYHTERNCTYHTGNHRNHRLSKRDLQYHRKDKKYC